MSYCKASVIVNSLKGGESKKSIFYGKQLGYFFIILKKEMEYEGE